MPRVSPLDVHLLKNIIIRQNWKPLTLYNLTRLVQRPIAFGTFYQQKFRAKKETRKYHGEALTQRQWKNMFKRSLASVVEMDAKNLASPDDGSSYGAGRGSGLDRPPVDTTGMTAAQARKARARAENFYKEEEIPYMMQTYAPMERRLDMAIFRAMFASSALQARQFVIHGHVKVNGQKMQYPQYMLNPGDMFSVDLPKVLLATSSKFKVVQPKKSPEEIEMELSQKDKAYQAQVAADRAANPEKWAEKDKARAAAIAAREQKEEYIKKKAEEAKEKLEAHKKALRAKMHDDSLEPSEKAKAKNELDKITAEEWKNDPNMRVFRWSPKPWMAPFAFIPRYLEVNHNTGHAVYLRHPVARAGSSEVPTPFNELTMQLAHNWWLRRR